MAGDYHSHSGAPSEVFDNARRDVAAGFERLGVDRDNLVQFSVRPDHYRAPNLQKSDAQDIANTLWDLSDRTSAGCLVYFSSHGSPDGILVGDAMLSPKRLEAILNNSCARRPTVVILSACFSGVFVPALKGANRFVLTAARRDRTSFGCGDNDRYPFFDACVLESLPASQRFPEPGERRRSLRFAQGTAGASGPAFRSAAFHRPEHPGRVAALALRRARRQDGAMAQQPKPTSRERLAFAGLQTARVAFYGAHYLAARLLARENVSDLAKPKHKLPSLGRLAGAMTALFAQDWRNVEAGLYPAPLDLRREARNALASARYLADIPNVVKRQREGGHSDVDGAGDDLPNYYRQNFHFQTDGYLSDRSAKLYDFQVEALFAGTADAMRRRAYVPVADYLARTNIKAPVMLDVAAGTGRFLSFVKSRAAAGERPSRSISPSPISPAPANAPRRWARRLETLAAPAEKIPLPDASVDVVTSIYLFHELPPKIRAAAASEIARVLKPGGLFVFADSIQYGDAPEFDGLLDVFPDLLHEPYYTSYAKTDLKQLFAKAGLMPGHVDIAYLTKIMAFEKPARVELGGGVWR